LKPNASDLQVDKLAESPSLSDSFAVTVNAASTNDNFANSISLSGFSASDTGSNIDATGELGEPNHAFISDPLNSVWWSWTAPEDGVAVIDTFGSNYDTSLGVYTGSAVNSLTEVASNDDAFDLQSQVFFAATEGTTYQIAVDGFFGNVGEISLNVNLQEPLPNDNFDDRISLTGFSVSETGTNFPATGELGEPNHASISEPLNSVWWSWTAPADGVFIVDTFGSNYDTSLGVYTGSAVDSLTEVASNDDVFSLQSRVEFEATAGTTYQIAVDGFSSRVGEILLNINESPATAGNDKIFGTDGDDFIDALAGNDKIFGEEGADTLLGSEGNDRLFGDDGDDNLLGGSEDDKLFGGEGDDFLEGGDGNDLLKGENGNDNLFGGSEDDKLFGGEGNDFLEGGDGNDLLKGENGNDNLFGDDGDDELFGGEGDDFLNSGEGENLLKGEAGNDILDGGNEDDQLFGGNGNDTLNGSEGEDLLKGEEGNDILDGDNENDQLFGGDGDDILDGGDAEDLLKGEAGNDQLFGEDGNDFLDGGDGNDFLGGDLGNDTLDGGDGDDFLNGAEVSNFGIGEEDRLIGNGGADTFILGDSFDIFYDDNAANISASEAGQAIIADFNDGEDLIQLSGLGSYELVEIGRSTQIREISDAVPEVIATIQGETGLDLGNSSQFVFV
jgi:Ca2+-binding RTX toxin-like protein